MYAADREESRRDARRARRLLTEIPDGSWRTLVLLLVQTGLRIGEALGLRWSDRELRGRRLRLRQRVRNGRTSAPKELERAGVHVVPEPAPAPSN